MLLEMKTKKTMKDPLHIRTDAKFDDIADVLRKELVAGKWAPGAKMPTWTEMCTRFDVGRPTLTRALNILKAEGFIIAQSTRGTYVAEQLPNLHRYALLFSFRRPSANEPGWNLFHAALNQQAKAGNLANGDYVDPIFGAQRCPGNLPTLTILKQSKIRSLAGILLDFDPSLAELQREAKVPVVSLGWDEEAPLPYTVSHDWRLFEKMAAENLAKEGAKRVAVLSSHPAIAENFAKSAAAQKLECPAEWQQTVASAKWPEAVRHLVHLMFSGRAGRIPDGFVVADDNLLETALAGIADAGVQPGRDVRVIAHGNLPAVKGEIAGVRRLCFSAKALLEAAIRLAKEVREKGIPPRHDLIAPEFL